MCVCIVEISYHMMKCWEYSLSVGIPRLVMQAREVPQHCCVVLYCVECSFLV